MGDLNLTAYIEKKQLEFEGICHPEPCQISITSSDMYSTTYYNANAVYSVKKPIKYIDGRYVSYGTDVAAVMLTAPSCQKDTD
ncbi:MAG: hypothetical protein HQK98_08395 [Nitrospirae bacterium]|nr:hypothetical protein [Nitrospirota bacterium]